MLNLDFLSATALEVDVPGVGSISIGERDADNGTNNDDNDSGRDDDDDDDDKDNRSRDNSGRDNDRGNDSDDEIVSDNDDDENEGNEENSNKTENDSDDENNEDSNNMTESDGESTGDEENDVINEQPVNSNANQSPLSDSSPPSEPSQPPIQSSAEDQPIQPSTPQSTEQQLSTDSSPNTEQQSSTSDSVLESNEQPPQSFNQQSTPQPPPEPPQPPQQPPLPPELPLPDVAGVTISETEHSENLWLEDSLSYEVAIHTERTISENLGITDSNELTVHAAISGPVAESNTELREEVIPEVPSTESTPEISILSGRLQLVGEENAEIVFSSSTTGLYSIQIRDIYDETVQTLEGTLEQGPNRASWDGIDSSGDQVPAGEYSYHITAQGIGGIRAPPSEGDGFIEVAWPVRDTPIGTGLTQNLFFPLMIVIAALTGMTLYLLLRKKRLTLYLPTAASDVIQDILKEYPSATVEDYVETAEDGTRHYKGVVISDRKSADKEWLTDIAARTKAISGVNSVHVSYQGKTLAL